jgi:hypothetical protein
VVPWSTRGTRSLACLPGVLDVEAWGSLDGELELGRSAWPRGRPGERGRSPVRGGVLDVEAWGSLGVGLELGRSAWPVVDMGNAVAPLSAAEWSTSRPGDSSTWS